SLAKSIHQLARNMIMRIGFENLPGCPPGPQERGRTDDMPPIAVSPDGALNQLLLTAPEFAWRVTDGVYVVRPAAAWEDPTDPLNFRTTPFGFTNLDVDSALRTLVEHVVPAISIPLAVGRRPVGSMTTQFPGGKFLDALNALIASGPLHEWEVA